MTYFSSSLGKKAFMMLISVINHNELKLILFFTMLTGVAHQTLSDLANVNGMRGILT